MSEEREILPIEAAEELIASALMRNSVLEDVARSVAAALVAAEASGQAGHGFSRLSDYVAQVRSGKVDGRARPVASAPMASQVSVDACDGFAYPALDLAVAMGADVAHRTGVAAMSVFRSHHCGALSVQVEKIAARGLLGLMVANSPPAMAPFGGTQPFFGTNPIAFAAPRPDGSALVIDLSLSRVARGKVMHAKRSGQPIPEGWALDAEGKSTTDPEAALAGSMLPIGGAKGTALALIVEVLAGVFTGARTSPDISSFFTTEGPHAGAGQFLLALRPPKRQGFADSLETLLRRIGELDGVRLPGSRREECLADARENGISVPRRYVEVARALAAGEA